MDANRYCPKVLMGNWKEESFSIEERMKHFQKKKERGELKVQRTERMMANVLKEVALSFPEDYVRYGNIVQLMAPDLPSVPSGDSEKCGLTLSCLLTDVEADSTQHLADGCLITASPHHQACVRNSFVISSADGREKNGDPLKYGESFTLRPAITKNGECLYVHSKAGAPYIDLGTSGEPPLRLTGMKNTYARWHCLHIEPSLRFETAGTPVVPNKRLVIVHSATNRRLAAEHDKWAKTLFGLECELTLHTYLDVHKKETAKNIWMIITQRHGENKVALKFPQ